MERQLKKNTDPGRFTERDIKILDFINTFGFCEISYIEKAFGFKRRRAYQILEKLIVYGLVQHEAIFHQRPGTYRLTRKGAGYTSLPEIANVPVGNYQHQLTIIDVYLKLRSLYPQAGWVSERKLENDKFADGLGKRGHLADGVLVMPDETKIAIEVELTQKGKNRLDQILKGYTAQFEYTEVWYYCAPNMISAFQVKVAKFPFVKVFNLQEFLA